MKTNILISVDASWKVFLTKESAKRTYDEGGRVSMSTVIREAIEKKYPEIAKQ